MNTLKVLADTFGLKSEGDAVSGYKFASVFPEHPKLDNIQPVLVVRSAEGDYLLSESEPAEVAVYIYRPETEPGVAKAYAFAEAKDAIVAVSLNSFAMSVLWDALECTPFEEGEEIINEYIVLNNSVDDQKDELDLTMAEFADLTFSMLSAQAK